MITCFTTKTQVDDIAIRLILAVNRIATEHCCGHECDRPCCNPLSEKVLLADREFRKFISKIIREELER